MLRRILLSSAGAMALAGAAVAAEPIPAPPPPPPPFIWEGFYIGATAGYNSARAEFSDLNGLPDFFAIGGTQEFRSSGFIGGGTLGYNWQAGSFVYGIETDFSGLTNRTSFTTFEPFTFNFGVDQSDRVGTAFSTRANWFGTTRGRIGLALDRTLVYFTAGVAYAHVSTSFASTGFCAATGPAACDGDEPFFNVSGGRSRIGYTVGGGVEYAITPSWSVKGEALFASFQPSTAAFAVREPFLGGAFISGPFNVRTDADIVVVRAGLNYKFNWLPPVVAPAPVVSKY